MTEPILFMVLLSLSSVQMLWALGVVFFLVLCVLIYRQRVQGRQLRAELEVIDRMARNNIESEFVLRAMKVATWRYDVARQTFTYESDFREGGGSYVPDIDLSDIIEGRTDFRHQEYQVTRPDGGSSYWEESYATVVDRGADGRPSQIIGTSMRIDERKQLEADLILARNKAEESDRLKTAFIANMGHEIRTPLNAIVGFADLLPVVQDEADRQQLISEIQTNNRKLLRIISGLVSMSEIEAGAKSLLLAKVDLSQLVEQMAETYRPTTNVAIETRLPADAVQLNSDRAKLREVLDQLMQNAVKFTTEGLITLGYDLEGDQVRIWVEDTGRGIADEDQKHIFDRFYKVDEYVPGTGLGLSVVQSHVSHLGGSVGVNSTLGRGSRFWILLPVA